MSISKNGMRALAVRQPFAEQIVRGSKKIEYRSKPVRLRERIYIYACKTDAELSDSILRGQHRQPLALGVIIGTVEIIDCVKRRGWIEWVLEKPRRLNRYLKPLGMPQPGIFIPFPIQRPRKQSELSRPMGKSSPSWEHKDVFPIIAEVIRTCAEESISK